MGVFASYFLAVLCLALCFFVSVAAFFTLFLEKWPKMKKVVTISYYVALAGLIFSWSNLFFSDLFLLVAPKGVFIVYAVTTLFCWSMLAFFSFTLLKSRTEKNEIISVVSMAMLFIFTFSLLVFTFQYTTIRDQERAEKMYESDTVSDFEAELAELDEQGYFLKTALIVPGASLCYTLGVTKEEALKIAQASNLKYYHRGNKLIVIVHPGDEFVQVCDIWILKSILLKGSSQ